MPCVCELYDALRTVVPMCMHYHVHLGRRVQACMGCSLSDADFSAIKEAVHKISVCVQAAELPSQVEALLRAVNTTNDFENELAARFGDASPAEVG